MAGVSEFGADSIVIVHANNEQDGKVIVIAVGFTVEKNRILRFRLLIQGVFITLLDIQVQLCRNGKIILADSPAGGCGPRTLGGDVPSFFQDIHQRDRSCEHGDDDDRHQNDNGRLLLFAHVLIVPHGLKPPVSREG